MSAQAILTCSLTEKLLMLIYEFLTCLTLNIFIAFSSCIVMQPRMGSDIEGSVLHHAPTYPPWPDTEGRAAPAVFIMM